MDTGPEEPDRPRGPQFVRISDVDLEAEEVTSGEAVLGLTVTIHRSEVLENSSLLVVVHDASTGLVTETGVVDIPTNGSLGISELRSDVSLERDRDYRVELRLIRGNEVEDRRGLRITGLDTLVPPEKELKMSVKDANFQVRDANGSRATVESTFYVEAMEDYGDVEFHVKAVHYKSNIMADHVWVEKDVEAGKTLLVGEELVLPTDYNYVVKLEAWRDGSMLKTWSRGLNLAPTRQVPEDVTEEKMRFDVQEFETGSAEEERPRAPPRPSLPHEGGEMRPYGDDVATPGLTAVLGVVALLVSALWRRRMK